jgi:hypothetical protein
VSIEILLEKVNLRLIRQSIENDAGTFLFHFKFDHIFFNKFFLQFHQVVNLQVFEGLPLLLALLYVPHLEIVISKIVTIIERMGFRLNVETVSSFLFANEVQVLKLDLVAIYRRSLMSLLRTMSSVKIVAKGIGM